MRGAATCPLTRPGLRGGEISGARVQQRRRQCEEQGRRLQLKAKQAKFESSLSYFRFKRRNLV